MTPLLVGLAPCASALAPWWFGPGGALLALALWCAAAVWLLDAVVARRRRARGEEEA